MLAYHHQDLGLSDQQVIEMYRYMLLARELDKRAWLLNRAGKIPFVVSCQGHEATQIGSVFALEPETDYLLPYYRDLGMVLYFGMTPEEIMLSNFAKAADPNSGGRQMPGHFGCRRLRIVTGSSPVTTQVPHAAGVALSAKMRGEESVVLTCFGDGSANQGDFHEGANFVGVHKLPVIFLCQNNGYAISTPLEKQVGGGSIAARAQGYGLASEVVDGNDVLAVYKVMKEAVQRGRAGSGGTIIEAITYRLLPHTSDDDDSVYRPRIEVEEARQNDPLLRLANYLEKHRIFNKQQQQKLLEAIITIIDQATEAAEAADDPKPESALEHVYGSGR